MPKALFKKGTRLKEAEAMDMSRPPYPQCPL